MSKSRAPTFGGLPLPARIYIPGVLGLAALAVVAATGAYDAPQLDLGLLALAAALCAAGNLFEVFAPASFSFQPNLSVFLCAALFLPPWAVAALAVACFLPGWLAHRFPWYMVAFNIANYMVAGVAAQAIIGFDGPLTSQWSPDLGSALALAAAAIAFVAVNHLLIALVVSLAQGRSLRNSAADMLDCAPMDLALAMTGACLAALWASTPPLALLVVGPMVLMYRALWVPLLEHRSRIEPKTGLYNSEYLAKELEDALASAKRRGSGLSVMMIDLDQLRVINNRHGHLAGDELIRAVAQVVAESAAAHDGIAARFGGDELCMLLPDKALEPSRQIAEKLRGLIEQIDLPFGESGESLKITGSTGIASYPEHADTGEGLLGAADAAVYDAKLGGRNRTRLALPAGSREALEMKPLMEVPDSPPLVPLVNPRSLTSNGRRASDNSRPPAATPPDLVELRVEDPPAANGGPPLDGSEPGEASPAAEQAPAEAGRPELIKFYVGLLCGAAVLIGGLAIGAGIPADPWLFLMLVGAVVALDALRIDVFERANLSPAAVPVLALAYFSGPLGPIAAEAMIALARMLRRDPVLKWSFDFGALSLAGAAAALAFALLPAEADAGALLVVGVIAGVVYYGVNSGLLAVVMGLSEGRSPLPVWRERLAWMVPHYVAFGLLSGTLVIAEHGLGLYAIALFGLPVLMLWIAEKQYLDRSRASVAELRKTNDELAGANALLQRLLEDNQQLLGRMHRSYLSTITSLARTVEAKDPYTSGHTERVAQVALLLASELGLDATQLRAVEVGAIIHDIGKIGIPDHILLKPGPLTAEETAEMRRHPEISSYILAELELPAVVKQMARSHHERFDGTGYPDELAGEEIPVAARILSVADVLDAMTSDRPYRKALPLAVARAEIERMAGTQFCPRVVAALSAAMDRETDFWKTFDSTSGAPELSKAWPA